MTVIFQLFCVDDLKMLRQEGRDLLRGIIQEVLENDSTHRSPSGAPEICLEASDNRNLRTGGDTPPQVREALQKRIARVSEQLQSPLPSTSSDLPDLDPSQPIVAAVRSTALESYEEEAQISRWAISCEVNNFNFYYPLLLIKEMAYTMFSEKTGKRPKGPDSLYSPFNERHPLYETFSNLKLINERHPLYNFFNDLKRKLASTQGAGDSSS
jgi:hypothetical protein